MNDTTQRTPETGTTMIELWDSFGPLKGRLERWSLDTATSLLRRGMMSPSTLAMGWFVVCGVIPNTAKPIRVKWLNPHKEAYGLREVQGNRADKEPIVVPPGEFQEVDSSIGAVWHVVARPGTDEERVVSQLGPMVAGGPVNIKVGN